MSETGRIYLTGMMGSGKSTLGSQAARILSMSFIDLDEVIESGTGQSVRDIFAEQGEDYFRVLESNALREITTRTNVIVALGGGTLLDKKNQEYVLRTGTLVYLSLSDEMLVERLLLLATSQEPDRPLLDDIGFASEQDAAIHKKTTLETVRPLVKARLPGYQCADHRLDVGGCSAEVGLRHLIDLIDSIKKN